MRQQRQRPCTVWVKATQQRDGNFLSPEGFLIVSVFRSAFGHASARQPSLRPSGITVVGMLCSVPVPAALDNHNKRQTVSCLPQLSEGRSFKVGNE